MLNPLFFLAMGIAWSGFILGLFALTRTQAGWRFTQDSSKKWIIASGIVLGVAHLAHIGTAATNWWLMDLGRPPEDPVLAEQMQAIGRGNLLTGLGAGLFLTGLMMLPFAFAIHRRSKLSAQGGFDTKKPIPFSPAIAVVLHFLLSGVFTTFKLGLMHGQLPYRRHDDPTAGKAIGFLFIPFFNLYWIFFSNHRLAVRINEELAGRGLGRRVSPDLAIVACVLTLIPFVNFVAWTVMWPIVLGTYQTAMNELARAPELREPGLAMAA